MTSPADEGSRLRKRRPRSGYEAIPNALLEDERLSYKARGILCSLLAKPDGWKVRAEAVERGGKEGREAIRSGIQELIAHGYYRRVRYSVRTERGPRWFTDVEISVEPVAEWAAEAARLKGAQAVEDRPDRRRVQGDGFPSVGDPAVGEPTVGDPAAVVTPQKHYAEDTPPASQGTPSLEAEPAPTPKRKGTRLPEPFVLEPDLVAWTLAQGLTAEDAAKIHEVFCDHWRSAPGQRGVKVDWAATWRNWVRRDVQNRADRQQRGAQGMAQTHGVLERAMDAAATGGRRAPWEPVPTTPALEG
jgi:hypothetical protein